MFENSGELVILALAVIVAFLIATIRAELSLARTLRAERSQMSLDEHLREITPLRLAPVDIPTVRVIEPDLRATA